MGCKKLTYYESNTALGENWKIFVGGIEKSASGEKKCLNYYAGGSIMPNSNNLDAATHTYGFNGQMKDDEIKGIGNAYDFGGRSIYDGRLFRFVSVDPRWRDFPYMSPYAYAANNPLIFIDEDGEGPLDVIRGYRYAFTIDGIHYSAKISFWNRQKVWFKSESTSGKLKNNFRERPASNIRNRSLGEKIGFSKRGSTRFVASDRSQELSQKGKEFKGLEFDGVKLTKLMNEMIKQNSTEIEGVIVGNNNINPNNAKQKDSDPLHDELGSPYFGLSDTEIKYQFSLDRGNFINQSFFGEESSFRVLEAEKAFNNQLDYPRIKFTPFNFDAAGITIGFKIFTPKKIPFEKYHSVRFL
jgi:RHS repeat-associated protein